MIFLIVAVLSTYNMDNRFAFAQVSIQAHGNVVIGQSFVLECQVTSFTGGASWSNDSGVTILTQCFPTGVCTDSGAGNYKYTSDTNGINVTIVSLTADEEGVTWTCSHSTYSDSYTVTKISPMEIINSEVIMNGVLICIATVLNSVGSALVVFIFYLIRDIESDTWKSVPYFSSQYTVCGKVVYGIQIFIVAAATQPLSIIVTTAVLLVYQSQYDTYIMIILLLLIPVYSITSVGIYLMIIAVNCRNCCKCRDIERKVSIKTDKDKVNDGECVHLTCTVPDITKSVSIIMERSIRSVCLSNDANPVTFDFEYTVKKAGHSVVEFTIPSFSQKRDAGSWFVRYGTIVDSNLVTLTSFSDKQKNTVWLVISTVLPIAWLVLPWLIWKTCKNINNDQDGVQTDISIVRKKTTVMPIFLIWCPFVWLVMPLWIWKHLKISIIADKDKVEEGDRVDLTCKVPDFKNPIFVVQDNSTRSVCLANDARAATDNRFYGVKREGNNVLKFSILSFSKERDAGSWLVRYGAFIDSNTVTLSAFTE